MRKLMRLLALTLASAMLLSAGALAAEEEEDTLYFQWLTWETPVTVQEDGPYAGIQIVPGEAHRLMLCTREDGPDGQPVFTPVPADQLTASEGLTVTSLAKKAAGDDPQKDCYISISADEWDKDYTISCGDRSLVIHSGLPDIGFYSEAEATTDSYLHSWLFSPTRENESVYVISTATDEANGRHLTGLTLAGDVADNAHFKLEKVEDNVYKMTRTGGRNYSYLEPRLGATWQDAGSGESYTDWGLGIWVGEHATFLVSEDPVPRFDRENPERYDDLKSAFSDQVTLRAGESRDLYLCFTFFSDEPGDGAWIMRNTSAQLCQASDSALQITADGEDFSKMTLRCDVPGTYTIGFPPHAFMDAEINAIYHRDASAYTEAEMERFFEENGWGFDENEQLLFFNDQNPEGAPFAELFPGETIDYDVVFNDPWYPITVTVREAPSFADVAESAWYAPAVAYVSGAGLMDGGPDGSFQPAGHITAAQLAQILYNREGKPAAAKDAAFQGVDSQWYAAPILWAAGQGIVTDAGEAAVVPTEDLTRQQIALMLYNYMGRPELSASLDGFSDGDQVSTWARDAMAWAVSAGVFGGSEQNGVKLLQPDGTASRAQTAQILMNLFR